MKTADQHNLPLTGSIKFGGKEYTDMEELKADLQLLIKQLTPKKKGTVLVSLKTPHRRKK